MHAPLLTLTTDFGVGSMYVAQLKAVLLRRQPRLSLIDLSHSIAPQAIEEGAWLVEQSCPWFPTDTLHLVVVDPGVGTARRIVLLRVAEQWFVGPDNGLFGPLTRQHGCEAAWEVTNESLWAPHPSPTFHGRDIMAPVSTHVLGGHPPEQVGPRIDPGSLHPGPGSICERKDQQVRGAILFFDPYGNGVTSIEAGLLSGVPGPLVVRVDPSRGDDYRSTSRGGSGEPASPRFEWVTTYGERPPGTRVALVGSGGRVEVAVVGGNAKRDESLQVGDPVRISW